MSGTKVHSNYEDLITFTRASAGHALRPVSYGTELVTNGTFDSDLSGWTAGASWTWSDGKARDNVIASSPSSDLSQTISVTLGKVYAIRFDISGLSGGTPTAFWGGSTLVSVTADGSYEEYVVATASSHDFLIKGSQALYYVDNVSVKEVLFDQPDGTLTLFEHPENVPRVEYDADGNRLGLLIEEAMYNLHIYSEDFSNSYWSKNAATISTDVTTAPDGKTTADKLVVNNATSDTEKFVNRNIYAYVNQTVTGSVFLKKAEYTWVQVNLYNLSSNANRVWVNLDTGAVGTNLSSIPVTVTDVGNGWYRVALTATIQQAGNAFMTVAVADADGDLYTNIGDEESGTFLWGAQLEINSFATSYIKTESSTASRAADVASIPVADFGYNQSAGTVLVEASVLNDQGANDRRILEISDGTTSNFFSVYQDVSAGENISIANQSGGSLTANFDTGFTITEGSTFKAVATLKDNDVAASVNGGSITSDTSTAISSALSEVNVGYLGGGTQQINGHIKSIKYYPRRLTNAQLQDLTS